MTFFYYLLLNRSHPLRVLSVTNDRKWYLRFNLYLHSFTSPFSWLSPPLLFVFSSESSQFLDNGIPVLSSHTFLPPPVVLHYTHFDSRILTLNLTRVINDFYLRSYLISFQWSSLLESFNSPVSQQNNLRLFPMCVD